LSQRLVIYGFGAKELCRFFIAFRTNVDQIAWAKHFEKLLHVSIAKTNAAMRSGFADGSGNVRSVNSVALQVQPDPPSSNRIVLTRRNNLARVVIGRTGDAVRDTELANGGSG
jgi:hypothetical protein